MKNTDCKSLVGDGVTDDTDAIQQRLDSGAALVELPAPEVCYLISRPLVIHSYQELALPRYCTIKLADASNCLMLKCDEKELTHDFTVRGGIWDCNNLGQAKNPIHYAHPEFPEYHGYGIRFYNAKDFTVRSMTLKDPVTFAVVIDRASYFTVEDIRFDFNYGNPYAINMDGVHLCGNCHFGCIRNLRGACYDDLVALNADEGSDGPITDIDVDGIYSENCHSAVRLLTVKNRVERIHIRNVYGTYYQYCIGITKYYKGESEGYYDALVLDNIFASKAERLSVYRKDGGYVYPLIWMERGLLIKNIIIRNLFRKEYNTAIPTVYVSAGAVVENMTLADAAVENHTEGVIPLLENEGRIDNLSLGNLRTDSAEWYAGAGEMGGGRRGV